MDGDGWARCGRGHRHWGRHGAAGLLLHHLDASGQGWVLLQHRALWSHHGGTWGVPGGARARRESAEQAALRETCEEVRVDLTPARVVAVHVDDHGGWAYDTVLADVPELLPCAPRNDETAGVAWVRERDVDTLGLHPGFAASWPVLRSLLAGHSPPMSTS